jgi:SAM-dependent methyltransferase
MLNQSLRSLFSSVLLATLVIASGCATAQQYGDDKYKPSVGQDGKDVIWVPTPDEMVTKMLTTAGVTSEDLVFDLGAGDGKIAIAAARQFGAQAVGIEFNPDMASLAQRNAERAGVGGRVKIIRGDIFVEDFSKASVLTLYLLPDLNLRLKPIILKMKPGTRVVSHSFDMGDWEADQTIQTSVARGFYWVVPAQVAGDWSLKIAGQTKPAQLKLTQKYQMLQGTITINGQSLPISSARVRGAELRFEYPAADKKSTVAVTATVNGRQLTGQLATTAPVLEFSGQRQ